MIRVEALVKVFQVINNAVILLVSFFPIFISSLQIHHTHPPARYLPNHMFHFHTPKALLTSINPRKFKPIEQTSKGSFKDTVFYDLDNFSWHQISLNRNKMLKAAQNWVFCQICVNLGASSIVSNTKRIQTYRCQVFIKFDRLILIDIESTKIGRYTLTRRPLPRQRRLCGVIWYFPHNNICSVHDQRTVDFPI